MSGDALKKQLTAIGHFQHHLSSKLEAIEPEYLQDLKRLDQAKNSVTRQDATMMRFKDMFRGLTGATFLCLRNATVTLIVARLNHRKTPSGRIWTTISATWTKNTLNLMLQLSTREAWCSWHAALQFLALYWNCSWTKVDTMRDKELNLASFGQQASWCHLSYIRLLSS